MGVAVASSIVAVEEIRKLFVRRSMAAEEGDTR